MKKLDERMTVSAQIAVEDIPAIKAAGFTVLMCNRPDGEDPGQPSWDEVSAAARAAGMQTSFLPMANREDVFAVRDAFRQVIDTADGPVFAYCRTGTRCEILWMAARSPV